MTDREKLIELIDEALESGCRHNSCSNCSYLEEEHCSMAVIADHLIANGVTVQKWIPVTERLPNGHDADADICVLAIHKACNKRYWHWRSVKDNPFDFTHWMPTPEPPKGD